MAGTHQVGIIDGSGNFVPKGELEYDDVNGDLVLEHVDSGEQIRYSSARSGWELDTLRTDTEPVVNVKAYGAVGDGTTDDTQAFTDAETACPAYGHVWVPPGTYSITGQILFDTAGIKISGPATIKADAVIDNPMFRATSADVTIQDIELDGNNNARIGIYSGGNNHTIERCVARNMTHDANPTYGFGTGGEDTTYRDCDVYDCDSSTSGVIVRGFRGGSNAARMKVVDCHVERIGAVDDADGVKAGGVETEIRNCYIEDCEKRAIKIDNNADRSEVVGNNCYWTTGTGGMLAPRRAGIQIQTSAEKVSDNHVEADNYSTGAGILDSPSGGSTIRGNTVVVRDGSTADGDTTDGIEVDGAAVVTENRIDTGNDARSGIRLAASAGNNTLGDNEIYGSGPIGISIQESGGTAPSLVSITGGVIRDVAEGIKIQNGSDIVITGLAINATTADITDPNAAATTGTNV